MAFSNSSSLATLKFDDVVSVILSKEIHRKSSGESSGNVVNVENRGKVTERWKNHEISKSRGKSKSAKLRVDY